MDKSVYLIPLPQSCVFFDDTELQHMTAEKGRLPFIICTESIQELIGGECFYSALLPFGNLTFNPTSS